MNEMERRQLEYLRKRKEDLISALVGAATEINQQIAEVKSGAWYKKTGGKDGSKEVL